MTSAFRFWQKPDTWNRLKPLLLDSEVDFILACQDLGGGFGNWPSAQPYLETCYYSLVSLGLCGSQDLCRPNILDYVVAHQRADGGFADSPSGQVSNLFNTFYAVVCLDMLDHLTCVKRDRTIRFINSKRRADGGFSELEDEPSSMIHTMWAVLCLDLLGSARTMSRDPILQFIRRCRTASGLYSNYPDSSYGYIEYTAYALIVDAVLDLGAVFDAQTIEAEIGRRRAGGGYSSYDDKVSNLSDTFWATYICRSLGQPSIVPAFPELERSGAWHVYLNLILRLMRQQQRLLPHEYVELQIRPDRRVVRATRRLLEERSLQSVHDHELVGFELYKSLPLESKRRLKQSHEKAVILEIDDGALDLPWETLLCDNAMLQLARPVVRANRGTKEPLWMSRRKALIMYDHSMSSVREASQVGRLLRRHGVQTTSMRFGPIQNDTTVGTYDVIHVCGHADGGGGRTGMMGPLLGEVLNSLNNAAYDRLLVVNACVLDGEFLKAYKQARYAILTYYGSLPGRTGFEFAVRVYEYLLGQSSLAESVRSAKTRCLAQSNDGGMSALGYQVWGGANLHLTTEESQSAGA